MIRAAAAAALLGLATAPAAAQRAVPREPDTLIASVLIAGRVVGEQRTTRDADGALRVAFSYSDRGRGPALRERLVLDADGRPAAVDIEGTDYLKNAVTERYRALAADGGAPARGAFFLALNGTPEDMAVLARTVMRTPARAVPLLPSGEAGFEGADSLVVHSRAGDSLAVVRVTMSGPALSPERVWLDGDGRFFARGGASYMVIRQGWESTAGTLVAAQDGAERARVAGLARTLAHTPAGALVLRDARIVDVATGKARAHMTLVINGARIVAMGPDAAVPVPAHAEVRDLHGASVMPGLWDMHVHLRPNDALMHLAAGVTSVRDLANDATLLETLRDAIVAGTTIGPRVVMAGVIDGPGPYAAPTPVLVSTPDEARAAVQRYAARGYVQIKIYSSVKPELVPVIADEAHRLGLRVSGHVPAFMTAEQFVRAGADEINHVNFLFLNFWADSVPDTRTMARITALARRGATLDLDGPDVRRLIALLRSRGTVIDGTLNVFEHLLVGRAGSPLPGYETVADRVPPTVRYSLIAGGLPVPDGMDASYRASFAAVLGLARRLYEAGVPLVIGTDELPGFALQRALELHAAAGIPVPVVLRMATLDAACTMHLDGELGTIAPGMLADLIVVPGDPLTRLESLREVQLVVKNGVVYDPALLRRAAGLR